MIKKIEKDIFTETGVKNPEEAKLKAKVVKNINDIFKRRKYNQKDAANVLGVQQPVISDLKNGRLHKFTLDRLFRFLYLLDWEIKIEAKKKSDKSLKPKFSYSSAIEERI